MTYTFHLQFVVGKFVENPINVMVPNKENCWYCSQTDQSFIWLYCRTIISPKQIVKQ